MPTGLASRCRSLSAGVLLLAYLAALFTSPRFHRHPGEDHVEWEGGLFHSHAPLPASPVPEDAEHDPHGRERGHLVSGEFQTFETVLAGTDPGNTSLQPRLTSAVISWGLLLPLTLPSAHHTLQIPSRSPPFRLSSDYSVLTKTDLPPPPA